MRLGCFSGLSVINKRMCTGEREGNENIPLHTNKVKSCEWPTKSSGFSGFRFAADFAAGLRPKATLFPENTK